MRETLRKANIKLEEFQKMQQGSGEIETLEVITLITLIFYSFYLTTA